MTLRSTDTIRRCIHSLSCECDPDQNPMLKIERHHDWQIYRNIAVKLCKYFKLSTDAINTGGLSKALFCPIAPIIKQTKISKILTNLRKIYGDGSLVICADSAQDFYNKKYQIPNEWRSLIPHSCIIDNKGLIFVSKSLCAKFCIEYVKVPKYQYHVMAVIFDKPHHPHFICYDCVIVMDYSRLIQFFQHRKWSKALLRSEYRDIMHLFLSQNVGWLHPIMERAVFGTEPTLIQTIYAVVLPIDRILNVITDRKKCKKLKVIRNELNNLIEQNEEMHTECIDIKDIHDWTPLDMYPFIRKPMNDIISVIGITKYQKILKTSLKENKKMKAFGALLHFIEKVEPKCCSCCKKQPDLMKRFKKCSRCRNNSYCGRRCQKRHWNQTHRYLCKEC